MSRAWSSDGCARSAPGPVADIKWWLGSTVTAVKKALAVLDAVEVDLDGQIGYVLPDDLEPTAPVKPWAALLPPLDPTTMGWFERDWYLGPHRAQLFDTNGNAGPTAWWDGRIVGGWRQSDDGEVDVAAARGRGQGRATCPRRRATRLTEWLGGTRVVARFPSPLSKQLAATERSSTATQSRSGHGATSTSLPSASASVHHPGAFSSLTMRPPAASAAATRASAWSCGT